MGHGNRGSEENVIGQEKKRTPAEPGMDTRPNPSARRPALCSRPDNTESPEYQASAALRNAVKRSL